MARPRMYFQAPPCTMISSDRQAAAGGSFDAQEETPCPEPPPPRSAPQRPRRADRETLREVESLSLTIVRG